MVFATLILGLWLGTQTEFPLLPPLEITAGDIIAVAVEYTIIHEDNPTFCRQFYGMTDYSTRTITLCALNDNALQRRTLLHEIVHVLYWKRGINSGEPFEHAVGVKAEELYQKFYGLTPISGSPPNEQIAPTPTEETKTE